MATISGDGGVLKFGTVSSEDTAAALASWSMDITADTIETTAMGSNAYKTFTIGKHSWSGTAEMHWDNADDTAQEGMETALTGQDITKKLILYPGGTSGVDSWEGLVAITGVSMSGSIGDTVKYNITFQGVGALTHTNTD